MLNLLLYLKLKYQKNIPFLLEKFQLPGKTSFGGPCGEFLGVQFFKLSNELL